MKTAVSVPAELFQRAEAAARRLKMSRSELYAKAIADFLKKQDTNAITKRLNESYSRQPAQVLTLDRSFLIEHAGTLSNSNPHFLSFRTISR
jgi:hypothetical protein